MNRQLDTRTTFIALTLLITGLILFIFVTPSIAAYPLLSRILVLAFSILPIVTIVAAVSFMFHKSEKGSLKKIAHGKEAKVLAALTVIAGLASLSFTQLSTHEAKFEAGTNRYVFENAGVGLLFAAFVTALILINLQKFVYWPFWTKADRNNADERQKFVRQKVFEKAYRYVLVLLVVFRIFFDIHEPRMRSLLPWVLGLTLMSMPALIAAWQKDS